MKKNNAMLLAAACGCAATVAQVANAQPYVVNAFGATLLQNVLQSRQLANDYIDIDMDGVHTRNALPTPDNQMILLPTSAPATPYLPAATATSNRLIVQYRAIGSVNGLQNLVYWGGRGDGNTVSTPNGLIAFGDYAVATPVTNVANTYMQDLASPFTINGQFANGGSPNTVAWAVSVANPGYVPFRSDITGTYAAQAWQGAAVASSGGVQTDIAPIDVPSTWGIQVAGTPSITRTPSVAGYGTNPRLAVDRSGNNLAGNVNTLVQMNFGLKIYGQDATIDQPAEANDRTIFDTQLAWAPIVPVVNYGVGMSQITFTDLQHLAATGRRENGENIVFVTREIGSGTHNAFMNSIGVDPSFGLGENIGPIGNGSGSGATGTNSSRAGADFLPGNKLATGGVRDVTRLGSRLSIGYIGGDGWDTNARSATDILAVGNNLGGRTPDFVRPTIDRILDNGLRGQADIGGSGNLTVDGWRIGGKAVLSTIGNPLMAPANRGGYGWPQYVRGIGENTVLADDFNPGFPASAKMDNVEAAAVVNNLKRSLEAFTGTGGAQETDFTPGQLIATRLIATQATDYLPTSSGLTWAANADRLDFVQNNTRGLATLVYNALATNYASFGVGPNGLNGVNTTRLTLTGGATYSDGNTVDYRSQFGATLSVNAPTLVRNRIVGDFNGDGLRNINDAANMIAAWRQRNGGPAWVAPTGTGSIAGAPGTDACIELLGDFNSDGNFGRTGGAFPSGTADTSDVRYWADGLAIDAVTGKLDRKAGFTAVDNAFAGNFFGTTKAIGAYAFGDSRADISGATTKTTRGHRPVGGDGVINAADVDYVSRQLNTSNDRNIDWATDIAEAANADLSADINGDLIINCDDVTEIVVTILGTQITDLNLDGVTDAADLTLAATDVVSGAVWSQGDVNCDGAVNQADRDLIGGGGGPTCNDIDFNNDTSLFDPQDIDAFLSVYAEGPCIPDTQTCDDIDFNNDTSVFDPCDIDSFLLVFAEGPCTLCGN
ncbi:MAG: hypothetical protein U0640_03345 [Phycisphaerales bacterium]